MLHTNDFITQIRSCANSKLAAASIRLREYEGIGAYNPARVVKQHIEALQVWIFILEGWINIDQHYNRVTEEELSNVIEEVLRLPYSCVLYTEPVPLPANQAPTVDAGPNQTLNAGTVTSQLNGTASDPEGKPLTYKWTQVSGPAVTILASTSLITGIANLQVGTYVFQLKVTDEGGLTATDTVQITVQQVMDTIYHGRSTNYVVGIEALILVGGNFQFNGEQDVPVPWYQGATLPQYCWVAIPNRTANHIKNKWYVDILNNGNIGAPTDLFGPPDTVSVNGVDYLFWITQYQTQFTATCLFKKV